MVNSDRDENNIEEIKRTLGSYYALLFSFFFCVAYFLSRLFLSFSYDPGDF